ncbi:MAG: hypothetical protein ACO1OB_05465 [Archangium sp.]
MRWSYVWGSFVAATSVAFVLTSSVREGVALGLMAAACVWFSLSKVSKRWRTELAPFTNAIEPDEVGAQLRALVKQSQTHM